MGLIALVPTQDKNGNQHLTLLLKDEFGMEACMKHVPVLVYEKERRVCKQGEPNCPEGDGRRIQDELVIQKPIYGLLLQREQITIPDMGDKSISVEPRVGLRMLHQILGDRPASPIEAQDLIWIPRMRDIFPDVSQVRDQYSEASADLRGLAGKLVVKDGVLISYSLADIDGEVRSMSFRPLGANAKLWGFKQAVTDIALLEINLPATTAKIELKDARGNTRLLTLKPKDEETTVDLLLANITPLGKVDISAPAEHFARYSRLTDYIKLPSQMPLPHFGLSSIARKDVENIDLPPVIRAVIGPYQNVPLARGKFAQKRGGEGASNRPICTLVMMDAPEEATAVIADEVKKVEVKKSAVGKAYEIAINDLLPLDDVVAVDRCEENNRLSIGLRYESGEKLEEKILAALEKKLGANHGVDVKFFRRRYKPEACQARTDRCSPLQPGISIGIGGEAAGTLGMFVKQGLISSAHVLNGKPTVEVLQPRGAAERVIGKVIGRKLDQVDAALASIGNNTRVLEQFESNVVIKRLGSAKCLMEVEKSGLGTHVTQGRVAGLGKYEIELEPNYTIDIEGFRIVPLKGGEISDAGDSGAIWYLLGGDKSAGVGLGLHVAGEAGAQEEEAIAADLNLVFTKLGLTAADIP